MERCLRPAIAADLERKIDVKEALRHTDLPR